MNIGKTIQILLIEDHELTRIGLKTALERYGNLKICGETASGKFAIELASKLNPDVILMDIGLHDLDGIESTKQIKIDNPDIKIVMLTSHSDDKEILASFASGADGYALKETTPDQLYAAIETVAQGDVWISRQVAEKVLRSLYGSQINSQFQITSNKIKNSIPIIPLSEREKKVLQMIVDGKSNQEIATELYLSLATAKSHVRNILNKLCVDDRTQAAVKAMREGIVC